MFAPIYSTLDTPTIKSIISDRIYAFDSAPQNVKTPYITWFVVGTDPHNQISGAPCGDTDTIQIDCWTGPQDGSESDCVALAKAVRDALDVAGQANRVIINTRDTDTKLFRIGLQVEFLHNRF
ncbi:DUF3168 domain-containing protein [Orrella sp. 11846]|uniref:DUF3168 domain-containing protein n=1 Tax=Orrella sp. 11846 TaxID=3409913 RepID=UPI003B5C5DA8